MKACQLHAESNQAVVQVVEYVAATLSAFESKAGVTSTSILFSPHAVFVNRQMLKASRETYQLALELGSMLASCDVTEITLLSPPSAQDVMDFGRAVADAGNGKKSPRFAEGGWQTVKLRKVVGLGASEDMSPPVRAARTYAAALMIVRSFYADLKRGKYELRQGIKRVAQKLVSQFDGAKSSGGGRLLLSIAAAPTTDADRSSILLSTSIVALAMANQLTNDRALLSALASAALLYDSGRQRLVGYPREEDGPRPVRSLNADEETLVPVSAVVALTALGKLHPPNVVRTVIAHEALALRDGGQVYQGRRSPLLLSRILYFARAFTELRVPRSGATPLGIDEALQMLEGQAGDNVGRALVKLLTGALGIFPAGTMVELSTGEMGVVLATPALPVDFARPPVRILYDGNAQLLAEPVDVDLAVQAGPGQRRHIRKAIDATDQQMKQMRAYVMQLATRRAKKRTLERMRAVKDPHQPSNTGPSSALSSSFSSGSAGSAQSGHSASSGEGSRSSASPHSPGMPLSQPGSRGSSSSAGGFASSGGTPSSHASASVAPASSGGPQTGGAQGASDDSKRAPARPLTRRWDPRSEDGPAPRVLDRGPGIVAPAPAPIQAPPPTSSKSSVETRSVNWHEYGRELAVAVAAAAETPEASPSAAPPSSGRNAPPAPEPSMRPAVTPPASAALNETDAILAAYLAEGEGGSIPPDDGGAAARSFGLRWTGTGRHQVAEVPSSGGASARPSSHGSAQGVERDSTAGASNAGLRWAGSRTPVSENRDSYAAAPSKRDPHAAPPAPSSGSGAPRAPRAEGPSSIPASAAPRSNPVASSPIAPSVAPSVPLSVEPGAYSTPKPGRTANASAWASGRSTTGTSKPAGTEAPDAAGDDSSGGPPTEGPLSKRKAGSNAWGAPRRDKR